MEAGQTPPDAPQGDEVDPAARDEAGDQDASDATPTSQDVPAQDVQQPQSADPAGDPANQVHRTAPPPPEAQDGAPDPSEGNPSDRLPSQTAGGSTDSVSVGDDGEAPGEAQGDES